MRKVLFWDFDGTLALSTSSADYLHIALSNKGYSVPFDEVTQHTRAGFTWNMPEISYVGYTGDAWWKKLFSHIQSLYIKHGIPQDDAVLINSDFKNYVLNASSYTLYEDAIAVLDICTKLGYENYILSNNFPAFSSVIKDLGLSEYFEDYIISADIGYEKPKIEIFEYALRIAQYPQICYMIGDNPIADIQGGKAARMSTILVNRNDESDADFVCGCLTDIPSRLL